MRKYLRVNDRPLNEHFALKISINLLAQFDRQYLQICLGADKSGQFCQIFAVNRLKT